MALNIPLPAYDPNPILTSMYSQNALTKQNLENMYYAPNILSQINNKNADTARQLIENKYLPEKSQLANQFQALQNKYYAPNIQSEIGLRGSQSGLAQSEAAKNNYLLKHPGFMAGDEGKTIQYLIDTGAINPNALKASSNINQSNDQNSNSIPYSNNALSSNPTSLNNNAINNPAKPFNTGNPIADAILNKPFANVAYQQKMTEGFNWTHLPVETKNQLVSQGYGMGIDPIKMSNYINQGLDLKQIAEKEGLDPDNLPPPIYPPTNETKTRVQQVQQVTQELDYLSSATTPLIKRYADTFAGYSPERIKDMLSNDPEAQKRFGQYIGALSVQTGLANGRTIAEGGRPGATVMKMVKDSALKAIDQHSPIKMSGLAYEEAQNTIDRILQKGAKIRTTTGMNPMSEIGKSKNKTNNEAESPKVIKWERKGNQLVRVE